MKKLLICVITLAAFLVGCSNSDDGNMSSPPATSTNTTTSTNQ
jgi:PBP1b-binding outer membrane lipoprotein LpoB